MAAVAQNSLTRLPMLGLLALKLQRRQAGRSHEGRGNLYEIVRRTIAMLEKEDKRGDE